MCDDEWKQKSHPCECDHRHPLDFCVFSMCDTVFSSSLCFSLHSFVSSFLFIHSFPRLIHPSTRRLLDPAVSTLDRTQPCSRIQALSDLTLAQPWAVLFL